MSHSHDKSPDPTVRVAVRVGGLPRSLGRLVERVLSYDYQWGPYDVLINGILAGNISATGPRRLNVFAAPGVLNLELVTQRGRLAEHSIRVDANAGERVTLRYTLARIVGLGPLRDAEFRRR